MTTTQLITNGFGYPPEYQGAKDPEAQVREIAKAFGLSPNSSLRYLDDVARKWTLADFVPPESLPYTQLFAWPSVTAIAARHFPNVIDPADRYCRAVLHLFDIIGQLRPFYNYRGGQITPSHLRQHERTLAAVELIESRQRYIENGVLVTNPILIVPAQFGLRHAGLSVEDASSRFIGNDRPSESLVIGDEFGFGTLHAGSMALIHPKRCVRLSQLHITCHGDEFAPYDDGVFSESPAFTSIDMMLGLGAHAVSDANACRGSVSGFIPPS